MDNLLIFASGILVGWFFTWGFFRVRTHWKQRRDLHASAVKANNEKVEKAQKAKQDSHKATGAFWRTLLDGALLLAAALVVGWVLWIAFFQ